MSYLRQKLIVLSLTTILTIVALGLSPTPALADTAYLDFNGVPQDTIAEFINFPPVTFSSTVYGAWRASDNLTLVNATGRHLRGPASAQLILDIATPQSGISFRFATLSRGTLRVDAYLAGAQVFSQTYSGTDLGAGFPEGFVRIGGLSFDRVVLSPSAEATVDDINIVAVGAPADSRLNPVLFYPWQTGAVYCRAGGIEVLMAIDDHPREGRRELFVTDARINRVGIPQTPTRLATSANGLFTLYRLESGEFQLVGPGLEVEPYTFIWDGCASKIAPSE